MSQDYQRHKQQNNLSMHQSHKYNLSLQDQIYLIFQSTGTGNKSLYLNEIREELSIQFNTRSVTDQHIHQIRYLRKTRDGAFRLHIFFDDICPHGFACTIPTGQCRRLHTCIEKHCCKNPMQYHIMSCSDPHCCYIHISSRRFTDICLELILYIYRRYWSASNRISLKDFKINCQEFIDTYLEFHQHPPIPNITWYQWQHLLRRYNVFFTGKSDIKLWMTEFDGSHEAQHMNNRAWYIKALHPSQFYAERACYNTVFHSVNPNHRNCDFFPFQFCPLLHLQHRGLISIMGPNCTRCNANTYCSRWHLSVSRLKKSVAVPGQAWYRPQTQLNVEIKQIMNGDNEYIDIMDMNNNENHFHQQWMNILHRIFTECRHTHRVSTNRDIPIRHVDQWMDGGFHREHNAIEIMWNKQHMDALTSNPLEIIQALIRFFEKYHMDVLDVYMENISKTIVLEYKVQHFKYILKQLACRLQCMAKQSCFNRRISFTIALDEERQSGDGNGYHLILEFCNANTFLSPVLLHEWFMNIIIQCDILSQEFVDTFMRFQETTSRCYFTRHNIKARSDSHTGISTAIAYFVQLTPDFNVDALLNPNINGIDLELRVLSESVLNTISCRYDTKFINYRAPTWYQYLKYNDRKQMNQNYDTITTQMDQYELEYSDEPEMETETYYHTNTVNTKQNQEDTQKKCDNGNKDIMKIYEYSDEEDESLSDIYNEIKSEDNRKENDRECASTASYSVQNSLIKVENEMKTNIDKNESQNISDDWSKEIQLMELNIDENAYVDIAEIEQKRHEMSKDLLLCEDKDHPLNKLCKYCFMEMKSEKHDHQCLFIPDWIRDGLEKPPEELKGTLMFVGHHYMT